MKKNKKEDIRKGFGVMFIILGVILMMLVIFMMLEFPDILDSVSDSTVELTDRELLEITFFCSFATVLLIVIMPVVFFGLMLGVNIIGEGLKCIFPNSKLFKGDKK